MWYPPCHCWYRKVDFRVRHGDKRMLSEGEKLPRGPSRHSSAATVEAPVKCNYLNYTSESTWSFIATNEKEQKPTRALITGESPIHESVVLRSSGDVWLVGKGRAGIGWGAVTYSVSTQRWDLLRQMPSSRPLQCLQPHARDPSLRLAAPSHRITSAILTPPSIMH